jgi:hypothetical protein
MMQSTTTFALGVLRVSGLIQIVLGVLFWTGNARELIPVHMWNGFLLVLMLWFLALLAAHAGAGPGPVSLAALWGLVVPVLGLTQTSLLPGGFHWIIQVLHLVVGLGAIGQGEGLAAGIRQRERQAHPV